MMKKSREKPERNLKSLKNGAKVRDQHKSVIKCEKDDEIEHKSVIKVEKSGEKCAQTSSKSVKTAWKPWKEVL